VTAARAVAENARGAAENAGTGVTATAGGAVGASPAVLGSDAMLDEPPRDSAA